MKMLGARHIRNQEPSPYATGGDFCRIFKQDMNRLYLLAFLLTADHSVAEKCLVGGLEDSIKGNPVFKEWAHSWARRTIIEKAIQMIRPGHAPDSASSALSNGHAKTEPAEVVAVIALPAFERFVFVMSALERHSDQECSLLLGCTRAEVVAARTRALQQIGRSAESHNQVLSSGPNEQPRRDDLGSALQVDAISHLAVSA